MVKRTSADPEGGGGAGIRTPLPPLRFVRGGVLWLFLPHYYHFFWLASLASIIEINYMCTYMYFHDQCSVWNGHPFSTFPLSK